MSLLVNTNPMKPAARDALIAEIIAEKYLGWEWSAGAWRDETGKSMGDYFNPMDDKAVAFELAKEFDVVVIETATQSYRAEKGEEWADCSLPHIAICFVLCYAVGEHPENWTE